MAAARLFHERDFYPSTLRKLGRLVGMEEPSLSNHFPSKQALLSVVTVNVDEELPAAGAAGG